MPEPNAIVLLISACVALLLGRRRTTALSFALVQRRVPLLLAMTLASFTLNQTVQANTLVDRLYSFGDDALEDAANAPGGVVGQGPANVHPQFTLDSTGPTGAFMDLERFGQQTYVNVSVSGPNLAQARPGAAPGSRGIRFNGVDEHLRGARLNFPQTSASSTLSGGPLNYTGIGNRGFQLWVYPTGPNPGTIQSVVSDLNQHGVRINAAGNWEMRYNGAIVNSNRAAAFNQWSHIMVARPFGATAPNGGSMLYLNGEAIAAAAGGYNTAPTPNDFLVIGAEPADATPVVDAEFFRGVLDDMNMFVLGTIATAPPTPGTYNFEFGKDNAFAAMPVATSGLSGITGDVNQDGLVNQTDINDLVTGWNKEKR